MLAVILFMTGMALPRMRCASREHGQDRPATATDERAPALTDAQAAILARMAAGATLTHYLLAAGLIALARQRQG